MTNDKLIATFNQEVNEIKLQFKTGTYVEFNILTDEQKAQLKGDAFTYEDFTPTQIAELQKPATDKVVELNALETTLNNSESLRVQNENTRISNEEIRNTNETDRISSENLRQENEVSRIGNENGRVLAENERVTAENARQTALDLKQDVLTEDNLGQFMDSELPTKSAPTSGDTVLGRDSVTGKAVEIPANQLGNNIDISKFVPYDNATKDVNIASNYFKTSKGFDFTFDAYNYFNTYQSDYYSTLEFKSKDSSDDNFGYLQITANAEEGFTVNCVDGNEANTNFLQVNINGIYSSKVFVSGEGFKTPFGTVTQALTADGGVFDLNTKADLVDGKVPYSQLPSNKTTFTYDILVSNWTLVSGKYEAVISNAGILSNSFVDVIPNNDHVDIVRSAQIYPSVLISEGSVKVYSKFLPSGTISVTVNII